MPDAARTVGPIAGLEARLDCRDKLGVMNLAGAGRTIGNWYAAAGRPVERALGRVAWAVLEFRCEGLEDGNLLEGVGDENRYVFSPSYLV